MTEETLREPETPVPQDVMDPQEIDSILMDLRGFGIADTDQLITMTVNNRKVNLRLANLTIEDEIQALIANLDIKGHVWVHQMRCDLLSRAVTWINGIRITEDLFAKDPHSKEDRPIRKILRDMFLRWGNQAVLILFKVYMVHCQQVEDNLVDQLPDATIMTNVEARFMQQIADELKATGVEVLSGTLEEATKGSDVDDLPD